MKTFKHSNIALIVVVGKGSGECLLDNNYENTLTSYTNKLKHNQLIIRHSNDQKSLGRSIVVQNQCMKST